MIQMADLYVIRIKDILPKFSVVNLLLNLLLNSMFITDAMLHNNTASQTKTTRYLTHAIIFAERTMLPCQIIEI